MPGWTRWWRSLRAAPAKIVFPTPPGRHGRAVSRVLRGMKVDPFRERDPLEHWYGAYNHGGPWTEEEFWRIPEDVKGVELHDGSLILGPGQTMRHCLLTKDLLNLVIEAVGEYRCSSRLDVRMAGGTRYRLPDLIVTHVDIEERPIDAEEIALLGEIVDDEGGDEWGTRMTAYAEAGIPWYLIIENALGPLTAHLHRLHGGTYELVAKAGPEEVLHITEPFVCEIDMSRLDR